MTKRKPASVGEILVEYFIQPLWLTKAPSRRPWVCRAQALGVSHKHINELCNDRRAVTADTALMLAQDFGNSADFWLNVQRRRSLGGPASTECWDRIKRAKPLRPAAA